MLKNNSKLSFAIKFGSKATCNQDKFYSFLETLTNIVKGFKVEGINAPKRVNIIEKKKPIVEIREGNTYFEAGIITTSVRNVIAVGVSSKYSVSFEEKSNFELMPGLGIYSLPIYDLEKDLNLIIAKVKALVVEDYDLVEVEPVCPTVTYHSNFIRVGNSRVDYDDLEALGIINSIEKKPVKKTKYNLKSIYVI